MRAEEFRARAAECVNPHYSELMHKGAAQLDEEARMLEARIASREPAGFVLLSDFNGTDR